MGTFRAYHGSGSESLALHRPYHGSGSESLVLHRPYHGSGSQSLVLRCLHPDSVLFLLMWDLCWTKWHRHRLLSLSTEAFHCLCHPIHVFMCHRYQGCTNLGCLVAMAANVGTVCVLSKELAACHHSPA